jgi:hypothetical protein
VTEGGIDGAGFFHRVPRLNDSRQAEIFAREVPRFLVCKELLGPREAGGRIKPFCVVLRAS